VSLSGYMTCTIVIRFGASAIAATLMAGCGGPDRAWVAGKLTGPDGAPVVGASVMARSDDTGASGSGETGSDGSYELGGSKPGDGVPPGNYSVRVVGQRKSVQSEGEGGAKVPAKYGTHDTSGLSFSVEAGETKQFDIQLDPS
jgi:hypothetical protein